MEILNGQPQETGKNFLLKGGFVISRFCFIYFTITRAKKIVPFYRVHRYIEASYIQVMDEKMDLLQICSAQI